MREVPVLTRIHQGDSLNPARSHAHVRSLKGEYRMVKKVINILCYEDDAILITESEDDLQGRLHIFQTIAEHFNILIALDKTEA